jgi:hypothetical protein
MKNLIILHPTGSPDTLDLEQAEDPGLAIRQAIGKYCTDTKTVFPERLYSIWHNSDTPQEDEPPGKAVCMLTDKYEAWRKDYPINLVASWLYGTEIHKIPIRGTVIFAGVASEGEDGIRLCGLDDYVGLALFSNLITASRRMEQCGRERTRT